MNNMYAVPNAGIPAIYIVVDGLILVMCVISHSVISADL